MFTFGRAIRQHQVVLAATYFKRDHNRKVVMDQAPLTVIGQKVFKGGYVDQLAIFLLYSRFARVRFQNLTAWMKLVAYFHCTPTV